MDSEKSWVSIIKIKCVNQGQTFPILLFGIGEMTLVDQKNCQDATCWLKKEILAKRDRCEYWLLPIVFLMMPYQRYMISNNYIIHWKT